MIFGGAWPLVVRGLTCLALIQLTSEIIANYILCVGLYVAVLIGTPCVYSRRKRVAITGPWCPLDALGCTRATMLGSIGTNLNYLRGWATPIIPNVVGIDVCNQRHEPGIPCKCVSTSHVEYVPALCTHRPSLLPIGWLGEITGLTMWEKWLNHVI